MRPIQGFLAAVAFGAAGFFTLPTLAQTVADEAQCADAKGSGDQNAIRQFCPLADWPQTVEPEVQTWIMQQTSPDVVFEGDLVVGAALPETVTLIEVPNFTHYRWAYLNGKRVLVATNERKVVAVY
jgi:hypothetical protein